MPVKVKQEDGTEIDAYTVEEMTAQADAKAKEAAEAAKVAEAERLTTEHEAALLEKEEALAEAQEKLRKAEDKQTNMKALREAAEGKNKEKSEEEKKNAEDLKALQETVANIQKQPFETAKANFIKANVGADKELGDKFDFFFKKLSSGAKTLEEYNIALESSMTLATGKPYQANDSRMTRTSVNPDFGGEGGKAESQDSQNFGQLLGITAEDKKQFGGVVKNGTVPLFAQTPAKDK